jgi:hypothetical protein
MAVLLKSQRNEHSYSSAKGACQSSPGQRPGNETQKNHKALKGRFKPCPNPPETRKNLNFARLLATIPLFL